jgi:EAL domain-containing protein (putative c-di-GMP-specific phosphodiesterase class I)
LVGVEALLRWNHPTLGSIAPDRFIPIAEENGLIVPMGRWVLEVACRAGARWKQMLEAGDEFTVAVNLSGRQLACTDVVSDVVAALARSGMAADALVLEITETALVEDAKSAAYRLRELRQLGVKLSIDDFGTGYSSLSYLRQFPVDILKIDRSFISSIDDERNLPAIVGGLLQLGRTLDLEMIAEGIELPGQRDVLRAEHCQMGQGYLFSEPVPPVEIDDLVLRTPRARPIVVTA